MLGDVQSVAAGRGHRGLAGTAARRRAAASPPNRRHSLRAASAPPRELRFSSALCLCEHSPSRACCESASHLARGHRAGAPRLARGRRGSRGRRGCAQRVTPIPKFGRGRPEPAEAHGNGARTLAPSGPLAARRGKSGLRSAVGEQNRSFIASGSAFHRNQSLVEGSKSPQVRSAAWGAWASRKGAKRSRTDARVTPPFPPGKPDRRVRAKAGVHRRQERGAPAASGRSGVHRPLPSPAGAGCTGCSRQERPFPRSCRLPPGAPAA